MAMLGLKEFLHRQQVIRLYRTVIRSINKLPRSERQELKLFAKGEFTVNGGSLDANKFLFSKGRREFESMARHLGVY